MERRALIQAGIAAGIAGLAGSKEAVALDSSPPRRPGPLRLNSNENPLGLAPGARRAVIDGLTEAHRYPSSARPLLLENLAARHSLTPDHIVLGHGSTEILRIAVATVARAQGGVVIADPTFEDIFGYARPFSYRFERVPLTDSFAHDVAAMRARAREWDGPVLVYFCNPNNPTGTITPCGEIDEWITDSRDNEFFVVDEAYFEFVDDPDYWSAVPWARTRPNVLVVRTFSKIFAMAGMRAGYGIAHPETVLRLRQHVTRNTPNHLAQVAALASLEDGDMVHRSRETNAKARGILYGLLEELELEYIPSHTNFVMHRIQGELETYITRMRENGVRVGRAFPPMLGYNRLSLGLPVEMEEFAETLRDFRRRGWV